MGARLRPHPFLLPDAAGGHRFCIHHEAPDPAPTALVLQCPPFGEEMNLARHVHARAARALAAAGAEVLQIDLRGCGDSSGEPGQVTWADWQADVARGADFLRRRHPSLPLWLWAQRAGALLAGSAVAADHLLLWQPLTSGHDLVRHWLRHQAAAALAQGRAGAPAMQAAQAEWQAGRTVDIAGYPITAALMRTCEPIAMVPPPGRPAGRIVWLDVHPQPRSDPPPAHVPVHQAWRAAGWQLTYACVEGPPYWQVPDTAEAPVLAARSVEALFGTTAA